MHWLFQCTVFCQGNGLSFPAVFLIFFIRPGKIKYAVFSLLLASLFFIGSLFVFQGGFLANFHACLNGFDYTLKKFGFEWLVNGPNLWGVTKIILGLVSGSFLSPQDLGGIFAAYSVVVVLLFLAASFYICLIEQEFWKQILLLVLSLFPIIFRVILHEKKWGAPPDATRRTLRLMRMLLAGG